MDHQSGNITGLFQAEEESLKVLPAAPVWYEREPNSYADFGGAFERTTRAPIVHDRQHGVGDTSDDNPTGGFQEDLTLTNYIDPMQAFVFADAREKPSSAPLNGAGAAITAVTTADDTYATTAAGFVAGMLVYAEGFAVAANNGLKTVSAIDAGEVTVSQNLANEPAPPASAALHCVGFQFAATAISLAVAADSVTLVAASGIDFTDYYVPGEWLFIGGDTTATRFADSGNNAPFYARIKTVNALSLVFDKTTGVQATDAGTGKTIQIFHGIVEKNEDDCSLIKLRTYTFERQYGCDTSDDVESEWISGAAPNQLTLTIPTPGADAKVTVDLAYIACQSGERAGVDAVPSEPVLTSLAGAVVVPAKNEPCYKPGINVYQHKITVLDPLTLNPTALVAYSQDATLIINNNLTGNKAIETFGNSGINIGEYTITGTVNGYWTGIAPNRAARKSSPATWHLILTKANAGVIFDVPLLTVNGRTTVAANTPVTIPLDNAAGKSSFGHTLLVNFFRYIPTVALAQ